MVGSYWHCNPCFQVVFVVLLCSFLLFFPFFCWIIFSCSMLEFLSFQFLWVHYILFICGYQRVQICWPITTSIWFKLIVIKVQIYSKILIYTFLYAPTLHFVIICPILHLLAHSLTVNFSYNWFYHFIFNPCVFFVDIFSSAQKQPKLVFFSVFLFCPRSRAWL